MKRIIALIAALALLLCSPAFAASGIFDPETMSAAYNASIAPVLEDLLEGSSDVASIVDMCTVQYSESSSSNTGSVYYWNKDYSFSLSFSAKDRYSPAEYASVWMSLEKPVGKVGYPLLIVSLVAGILDPELDAYAFYQWVFEQENESRFESKNFDAYMVVADDGSYMGFSMFPS